MTSQKTPKVARNDLRFLPKNDAADTSLALNQLNTLDVLTAARVQSDVLALLKRLAERTFP